MNLLKIKILLEDNKKSINWLSREIGMSNQNLYKCFEKNRIEANDLEKIAKILEVPITYFFNEDETIPKNKITTDESSISNEKLLNEIKYLEQSLEFQNNEIKMLKEMLQMKDTIIAQMKELNLQPEVIIENTKSKRKKDIDKEETEETKSKDNIITTENQQSNSNQRL